MLLKINRVKNLGVFSDYERTASFLHIHVEKQILAGEQHGDAVQAPQGIAPPNSAVPAGQARRSTAPAARRRHEGAHHLPRNRGLDKVA